MSAPEASDHVTGVWPELRAPAGPDVIAEVFDGEVVVVHLGTGVYYSFDRAATALWQTVCAAVSVADLEAGARVFLDYLVGQQLAVGPVGADAAAGEWPGVSRFTDMADMLLLDPIHDIDLDGSGWPTVGADRAAS